MAAKNDITGDSIKTKTGNEKAYAEGWERIFGKTEGGMKKGEMTLITAGVNVGKSRLLDTDNSQGDDVGIVTSL